MSSYRTCKYGCNTQITWDTQDSLYRESDGRAHDRDRCQKIKSGSTQQQKQQQQPQPQSQAQPKDPSLEWDNLTHDQLVTKVLQEYGIIEIINKLQGLTDQISHLTKLVYAQSQDHNNPHTLLDNR